MTSAAVAPGKTNIGWIGTGVMGSSMCGHLLAAGFAVTVFNRTAAKAEPLLDAGARWADSPKAVAQASDVVFSIVGFPGRRARRDARADEGWPARRPGNVLVDMTTSEPSLAVEIAEAAGRGRRGQRRCAGLRRRRRGPRSPAVDHDRRRHGGRRSAWPLLASDGQDDRASRRPAGAGQHTKMVNQILIATNMIGVCEALLYGYRAGSI